MCLPLFAVLIFSARAVKLSVPLLVLHQGQDPQGTVYLLDETGRSDVIAQTLKGNNGFSNATIDRYVSLSENTTLVEPFVDLKDVPKCTDDSCPNPGSSCYKLRDKTIVDTNGPQTLLDEASQIAKSRSGSGACRVIFSANTINATATPFANAWAPTEATMLSIVAIIVVILFIIAVLPSLLINDSDILPEVDAKTD